LRICLIDVHPAVAPEEGPATLAFWVSALGFSMQEAVHSPKDMPTSAAVAYAAAWVRLCACVGLHVCVSIWRLPASTQRLVGVLPHSFAVPSALI
jgi:hypothetical protein